MVRHRKWLLLAVYWVVQATIAHLLATALMTSGSRAGPGTLFPGVDWQEFADNVLEPEWLFISGIVLAAITLLQAILVLPTRKPRSRSERGWPLWASLIVAGAGAAALFGGLTMSVLELACTLRGTEPESPFAEWAVIGAVVVAWSVATPLFVAFSRRHRTETALGRIAAMLLTGTIVEVAAIMPLDVMVRRKSDCYCFSGTLFALIICGGVGLLVAGPAVFMPVLARRRKRWYAGRCENCGYDMSATRNTDRCPECGLGWAPESTQ